MTAPFLVVGAGPTGLGCAAELATIHPVELIDRIPVPGGEAGWSAPEVTALVRDACRAGVRFRLGNTAVRWEAGRLLMAGPGRIGWLPGERLFYAGGLRPATAADLFITGDRPAGVLPATVARHLLIAQNRLWDRLAIIGDGPWAQCCCRTCARRRQHHHCHHAGLRSTGLGRRGDDRSRADRHRRARPRQRGSRLR